jgi:hypothetical protein
VAGPLLLSLSWLAGWPRLAFKGHLLLLCRIKLVFEMSPEWELEKDEEDSNFVFGRKKTQQMTVMMKGGQMIQSWLALLLKGPSNSVAQLDTIRTISDLNK